MKIETHIIKNRSVILCGGTYEAREEIIAAMRAIFLKELSGNVFRLEENIKFSNKYIRAARNEFPMVPSKGIKKSEITYEQWSDCHLDWTSQFKNILIVIPEFQKLYENDLDYFYELLGHYLSKQSMSAGRNRLRFIMTFEEAIEIEFARIPTLVGSKHVPSEHDLAIFNLP